MAGTKVHCDRCHLDVDGFIESDVSGGCYVLRYGYWRKFARDNEHVICDSCMWSDPKYQAEH